tara:strand:- start:436 stop:867 length:432 start_codon:yes stop_codon:yes gene_type:complete
MSRRVNLKGTVKNGSIMIKNESFFSDLISQFENKDIIISLKVEQKKRSDKQNDWYWGVAIPTIIVDMQNMSGEIYTKEDIHDWNLSKAVGLKTEVKEMFGETIVVYKQKRTSRMTTTEFNDFKEKIQKYWAENNIDIPDPKES